jgi:hypothetical protein
MRMVMLAGALTLLVSACGEGGGQPPAPEPSRATDPATAPASEANGAAITGPLGGDAQLEGGCAWVTDGGTRWNVQYPQGYTLTFDPLTLTAPDGTTAAEGDILTVAGRERSDVMTTCQVGPVWEATSVTFEG